MNPITLAEVKEITAEVERTPEKSLFEVWERHTIMSGKVATYAESFTGSGHFPDGKEAIGGFEISASRDAVMCHRMAISTRHQRDAFEAAFRAAWAKHLQLKS